ncbi:serine protease inhibitor Kazal-type 4 isoform X1 [Leopardus geoffroyi]|uniref:serine protease inhibitor Kazal-type 4 isoform X1 n=1 Tax=Leopardus geoffroyi TaxID=46844 RepID=UPI001E266269|nr:serine protease inhibitor Kazal-type 4 isoform X1 [Leopardus geoffroyi]
MAVRLWVVALAMAALLIVDRASGKAKTTVLGTLPVMENSPLLETASFTEKCQCPWRESSLSQECPSVSTWRNLQSVPRHPSRSVALMGLHMTVNASSA